MKQKKICGADECTNTVMQKGYCPRHYMKWYRYGDANFKAGFRGRTPTVISWTGMKQRCKNPKDPSMKRYGGRGISFDPRWELFENFLEDMGERPQGTTLDRVDNNKGYSKENCRWATSIQQMNNTSQNVFITHKEITMTVSEWSRRVNIPSNVIRWRVKKGWAIGDVLGKPVRSKKKIT